MRKAANTLWGIVIAFVFFGFIGKFNHWPGASIAIILGYSLSIFALLLYFIARYKDKSSVKITTYFIYFFFFVSAFGSNYFTNKISKITFDQFSSIEQRTESSNATTKKFIQGIRQNKQLDQKIEQYLSQANLIIEEIEGNAEELIRLTGGRDGTYNYPLAKDNLDAGTSYFYYQENGRKLQSIISQLELLNQLGAELESTYQLQLIQEDLEPQINPFNPTMNLSWEDRMINHLSLSNILANFELLESRLLQNQLILVAL